MAKLFGKIVGLAVVAAGVYAVGKYLNDYTDYKAAGEDDLSQLKNGGEKAREAAKRTYIAIRSNTDVTEPAGDLGRAAAEVAEGAGRLVSAVGTNTVNFVKNEKEKFDADPAGYKEQVSENLKDMGQQAAGMFNTVKGEAANIVNEVKESTRGFRDDPQDFVQTETEPVQPEAEPVQPEAEPVQPEAEPVQPEAEPVQPEAEPVQPEAEPVQPEAEPVQPEAESVQPEAEPVQPEAEPVQPEAESVQPETTPVKTETDYFNEVLKKDHEPEKNIVISVDTEELK